MRCFSACFAAKNAQMLINACANDNWCKNTFTSRALASTVRAKLTRRKSSSAARELRQYEAVRKAMMN